MKKVLAKLPWGIAGVILVGLIIYGYWPQSVEVDSVPVTKGTLEVTVNDDGETRIREKYVITAPITGKLLRLKLHAGDTVIQQETELAHIEPSDPALLDARTQAELEARVRAAEAAVERAEVVLQGASESYELAQHEFQRASELVPARAISKALYDAAEHRLKILESDSRSAELSVKVAEFELEHAKAAAARFDDAESGTLSEPFRLVSPISGKVLRVLHEDAGIVSPGTALIELGDPQDLEIEIDVLSTEAVQIEPSDRVYIDHWGGEKALQAVVRLVEPSAFLKVSALGVEEKRVNVIADFIGDGRLRDTLGDGFRIEARIVVSETSPDALKVDAGALFREGADWYVFRIVDGVAKQTRVELGATNGFETEIIKGLSETDQVVLHPTGRVRDGVSVKAGH